MVDTIGGCAAIAGLLVLVAEVGLGEVRRRPGEDERRVQKVAAAEDMGVTPAVLGLEAPAERNVRECRGVAVLERPLLAVDGSGNASRTEGCQWLFSRGLRR